MPQSLAPARQGGTQPNESGEKQTPHKPESKRQHLNRPIKPR